MCIEIFTCIQACEAGTYQSKIGQSNCSVCPAGYYCERGSGLPVACPAGFNQTGHNLFVRDLFRIVQFLDNQS